MVKHRRKRKSGILSRVLILLIIICALAAGGYITYKYVDNNDDKNNKEPLVEEKKLQIVDLDSNSRNIAVMINNVSTVWGYQSGLQDAYIVYEMIVEGGITRLMAIYKDANTERIGSIRSSRHYFLDYVLENDALYVHVGGSPQAYNDIKSLKLANFDGTTIWRDKTLKLSSEHTAFTSIEKIKEQGTKRKFRDTTEQPLLLNYSVDDVDLSKMDGAKEAKEIFISYSPNKSTSYTYDITTKKYKRFQSKKEHVDYVTGEQYTAKNIIVYQVANSTIPGDDKGRQNLSNIGKGEGYYISNGWAVPITWEKTSRESQTKYRYKDGKEIIVNDGNTYIQIQPKNRELTIN